jgi:type IV pilus assembly protein PilC
VIALMVFLVTYVVPTFATLYTSMQAQLPQMTVILIAIGTTARNYILAVAGALAAAILLFRWWAQREGARETVDRIKMKLPLAGEIWLKYQVAQLARILSTLLTGGIPLVQAMETAADSLATPLLRRSVEAAGRGVREGQPLSGSLRSSKMFPPLALDMIEVGESTGALPSMLNSVAEFFEDDVNTRMQATLSLIEPAIMIVMGSFVAFVLIALYLPIFSLADTIR